MITTIKKTHLRKRLIEACIAKTQFTIDYYKDRIKLLIAEDGKAYDDTNYIVVDSKVSEINLLNTAIEPANNDLALLEHLKITQYLEREEVSPGAIVFTNHKNFFISASIEKIIIDSHAYICISTSNPLYNEMAGMHNGDAFKYHATNYKIKEIF